MCVNDIICKRISKNNWLPGGSTVDRGACAHEAAVTGSIRSSLRVWKTWPDCISISQDFSFFVFFLYHHHWVSLSSSLSSFPASAVTFTALFSYLLPVMCKEDGDRLITTCWNSDLIITSNCLLHRSLGAVARFFCLMDETNAVPNSRYVEQTAWLMCLFRFSQSLMIELPQIRALVPFCCQRGSLVTWGEFCFVFSRLSLNLPLHPPTAPPRIMTHPT